MREMRIRGEREKRENMKRIGEPVKLLPQFASSRGDCLCFCVSWSSGEWLMHHDRERITSTRGRRNESRSSFLSTHPR